MPKTITPEQLGAIILEARLHNERELSQLTAASIALNKHFAEKPYPYLDFEFPAIELRGQYLVPNPKNAMKVTVRDSKTHEVINDLTVRFNQLLSSPDLSAPLRNHDKPYQDPGNGNLIVPQNTALYKLCLGKGDVREEVRLHAGTYMPTPTTMKSIKLARRTKKRLLAPTKSSLLKKRSK